MDRKTPQKPATAGAEGGRIRASRRVADRLEEDIIAGRYEFGEALPPERELMEVFDVSRNTIREAVFELQNRGFVQVSIGARPRVSMPDTESMLSSLSGAARLLIQGRSGMANLQEARSLFEAALARHAARHATPKQIDLLSAALHRNKKAIVDAELFLTTDIQFHLTIIEMPGNPIFTSIHYALSDWLANQRRSGMMVEGAVEAVYQDHRRIFEAIADHDVDRAEQAMMAHLDNVARYFWSARDYADSGE